MQQRCNSDSQSFREVVQTAFGTFLSRLDGLNRLNKLNSLNNDSKKFVGPTGRSKPSAP